MTLYSIRTLCTENNLDWLIDKVDQIQWRVTGLCETYRKGEGLSEIQGGYKRYEIGKTEGTHDAEGLAFQMHPKIKECVTDFKTHSNRKIKMKVNLKGKYSVTVMNAYAPTFSAEDEKMDTFYDIEREVANSDSKYRISIGDFTAEIGTKTKEDFKSMGAFGIEERNERGDHLIEFAWEHKLIIANKLFQKPKNR